MDFLRITYASGGMLSLSPRSPVVSESIPPLTKEINIAIAKSCVPSINFDIEVSDLLENIRVILRYILSQKQRRKNEAKGMAAI